MMQPPAVELTARQQQVAALVAAGYTTKRIAAELRISHRRVQRLIVTAARQLGASQEHDDRVQLALWWTNEHRKAG